MRQAQISDRWRHINEDQYKGRRITEIHQSNGTKCITKGLLAIVGSNGSGKTSFIDFLTNPNYSRVHFLDHTLKSSNGHESAIPGNSLQARIIDPSTELKIGNANLLKFKTTFGQEYQTNIPEEDRKLITYVLGELYDNIAIEEVCIGEDIFFPRFIFTKNEREFDNETLSFGEQIVAYIYWTLLQIDRENNLCFIEEPETGLSPVAQLRLADLLACIADKKKLQIFTTTHSPFIVSKIGHCNTIVLRKFESAEWVNATENNYLEELGIIPICKTIYYVEDSISKLFFEFILCSYCSDKKRYSEIISLSGESNIYEVVSRTNGRDKEISHFGIIDGDQRKNAKFNNKNFIFLPGDEAPEKLLIQAVNADITNYAYELRQDPSHIKRHIDKCKSLDHHDFFIELAKLLCHDTFHKVVDAAFFVWLNNYTNRNEIWEFINSIDNGISEEEFIDKDASYKKQE